MGGRPYQRKWILCSALGVVTFAGALALLAAPTACSTHQCDFTLLDEKNAGEMVDDDTWESSPLTGTWMKLGPSYFYTFHVPKFANRTLVSTEAYVAVDPVPSDGGSSWTIGAGNIVLFGSPSTVGEDFTINVANGTCGDYYVRIVLRAAPMDGGVEDGGALDATADVDAQ